MEGGLPAGRIRQGQTQRDRVCQGLCHTWRAPVPPPKTHGHTFSSEKQPGSPPTGLPSAPRVPGLWVGREEQRLQGWVST